MQATNDHKLVLSANVYISFALEKKVCGNVNNLFLVPDIDNSTLFILMAKLLNSPAGISLETYIDYALSLFRDHSKDFFLIFFACSCT